MEEKCRRKQIRGNKQTVSWKDKLRENEMSTEGGSDEWKETEWKRMKWETRVEER